MAFADNMTGKTKSTTTVKIISVKGDRVRDTTDIVVRQSRFSIYINGSNLASVSCTAELIKEMAIGMLITSGMIENLKAVSSIDVDENNGRIMIEGRFAPTAIENFSTGLPFDTGCFPQFHIATRGGCKKVKSALRVSKEKIVELSAKFSKMGELFKLTGGVHACAIATNGQFSAFAEDVSRHTAVDKAIGKAVTNSVHLPNSILLTSGRSSSLIIEKVATVGIPVIVSRSAPVQDAVNLSDELLITLIGFARGKRMNIYSHPWRIKL